MNVIILTNSASWGGLEVHTVAVSEALVSAGHHTSVVCFGDHAFNVYRDRLPKEVALVNVGSPERRSVWSWWRALARIKAEGAILEKGTWQTGGLALDCALRLKARRYFTVQQLEPPELPPLTRAKHFGAIPGTGLWWYRWRWSVYLRSLVPHLTICVSETMRRRLAANYRFSEKKLMTIPNGVDPAKFQPDAKARARIRTEWGIPDDAFVFGSVGRFSPQKALEVAIEAFATVVKECPGRAVYLVLVGDGDQRSMLMARTESLGLEGRVLFPGFAREPREAYQGLDVFVIPSRYEGLPFALVEAMASGCEIIGTPVGGVPEAVSSPKLGTLVPPDNPQSLAEAMIQAVGRDSSDRAERGRAARQHVAEHFNLRTHCMKIVSLLQS
jgi:glycosyltransferase involved in cell wall biosynthesis